MPWPEFISSNSLTSSLPKKAIITGHSTLSLTSSSQLPNTIRLLLSSSAWLVLSTSRLFALSQSEGFPYCLLSLRPTSHMIRTPHARQLTTRCAKGFSTLLQEIFPSLRTKCFGHPVLCLRVYRCESLTHPAPYRPSSNPKLVTDTAPKERWNLDILEPQGEARLREVVDHIKAMVADLPGDCKSCFSLELS